MAIISEEGAPKRGMSAKERMARRRAELKALGLSAKSSGSLQALRSRAVTPLSTASVTPSVTPSRSVTPAVTPSVTPSGSVGAAGDAIWTGPIGQEFLRVRDDYFERTGTNTLTKKAIEEIRPLLPEAIRKAPPERLHQGARRAMECRPAWYDWALSLIRQWGIRHQPWLSMPGLPAREFLDDLIASAGKHRLAELRDYIDHLERQRWCWKSQKLHRLLTLRDRMKTNPLYAPMLMLRRGRTVATDAIAPAMNAFMQADPDRLWTLSQFARKLRKSRGTVYLVAMDMSLRDPPEIMLVHAGRGLWGPPTRTQQKSVSLRMIESLLAAPEYSMRFVVLERTVGEPIAAPLFRLRGTGVVKPGDPHRRSPIKLSEDALAKIRDGWSAEELAKIRARRPDLRHQ